MFRKRLSLMLLMLAGAVTLHSQHGGGSDQTASPWWIGAGVGVNTWVGDEEESSARWNMDRPGFLFGLEAGRWMSPELGLSLRLSAFSVHGKSRNAQHPLIDYSGLVMTDGQVPYQPFDAFGLAVSVTMSVDWTNLGVEKMGGLHFYSPLSVGAAFLMGGQKNPDDTDHQLNGLRAQGSFALSAGLGLRYGLGAVELFGEAGMSIIGSAVDWSPEDGSGIDMMPSLSLGLRYALPSRGERRHDSDYQNSRYNKVVSKSGFEPHGLVDDMLSTNEQLHLPATVVKFTSEDDVLSDKAFRQLNLFVSQMDALGGDELFYIIGTADNARKSQAHNRKLCVRRCQAVYDALVGEFGVDGKRLRMLPGGGLSEYAHQYGEQMVLIIQRTPETEEVVERWISTY